MLKEEDVRRVELESRFSRCRVEWFLVSTIFPCYYINDTTIPHTQTPSNIRKMASSQDNGDGEVIKRRGSESQGSENSQTAAEFISSQLQLEEEAREALPYKFDSCTRELGPLRQLLFACITCNPPPNDASQVYNPAGVCYSCSIQCHGEHELVELFNKRSFVCDCGTTRLPKTAPCALRINPETKTMGGVHSEEPAKNNEYNQNFANRFCGCERDYDPHQQKGSMFQCVGLGSAETGACGEDWWHPGCVVGLGPHWNEEKGPAATKPEQSKKEGLLQSITEVAESVADEKVTENGDGAKAESYGSPVLNSDPPAEDLNDDEDEVMPQGFPDPDEFVAFVCYKCVEAHPWIKRYAGTDGFLAPVFHRSAAPSPESHTPVNDFSNTLTSVSSASSSLKRKVEDVEVDIPSKRLREDMRSSDEVEIKTKAAKENANSACKRSFLPPAPTGKISLFLKSNFRNYLCRCSTCFPLISPHPYLLDEEESYEQPLSEFDNASEGGNSTVNSGGGSIHDRGQAAFNNMDRVKAIEAAMAFNNLKEKLKPFFQSFAESGKAVGADDIKEYFEKIRGDEQGIKEAQAVASDNRKEGKGC